MDQPTSSGNQPQSSIPIGQPVSTPTPSASSTTSTRAIVTLILGILSLTCCGFLTGIPAIFLGRADLKLIEEGKLDPSNKTLAKVGMIIGIVGTVLSLLGTLVYIILFAIGISANLMQGNF